MAPPPPLVHGTIEAKILHSSPYAFDHSARATGWLLPRPLGHLVQGAQELVGGLGGLTRLHVAVSLDHAPHIARTADVLQDPKQGTKWNETIHGHCAHHAEEVIFSITIGNAGLHDGTVVGHARLPVRDLPGYPGGNGPYAQQSLSVLDASGKELRGRPQISLEVKFEAAPGGVGGGIPYAAPSANPDPAAGAVPRTYFPQHPGSRVTLYQDAHCLEPRVELPGGGGHYQRGRCWEDVFDAIDKAEHLVYIAGWSVNTSIKLVRRDRVGPDGKPEAASQKTLGEVLKDKASKGVRVLMLVWNDLGSVPLPPLPLLPNHLDISLLGCQYTHDEDTVDYFDGTGVHCVKVRRRLLMEHESSALPTAELRNLGNSHHQKMVIVDHAVPGAAAGGGARRQIVSFVGGLDLCDGRYDSQEHCLFSTLGDVHKDDFHQVSVKPAASLDRGGPRTPWHDIHSRLEGPAAWDVLRTFERRWNKQGDGDLLLVDVTDLAERQHLLLQPSEPVVRPDDDEAWSVQVFRSIDSTSVEHLPSAEPQDASERLASGLACGHLNKVVDRSVQDAYIHAIRRAKRFVYIENQYLIGGAFDWDGGDDRDSGAQNLVAKELSLKIASKIRAGEDFAAYVVLPMWPEGVPDEWQAQQILYWQRLTMEMMYRDVAAALRDAGKDVRPEEHLLFFCLGNREPNRSSGEPAGAAPSGTHYAKAQDARRFMIYVHSKMMIVDDEYIIVGSANINQRSMDGAWDTEIAMGAYQPHYVNANGQAGAKGQVRGFRMSLWYEHLGCSKDDPAAPLLLSPEEPRCVAQVKTMAEVNWDSYAEKEPRALPHGHLLPYPIQVDSKGSVTPKGGVKCFPDTEAPILGARGESLTAKISAHADMTKILPRPRR